MNDDAIDRPMQILGVWELSITTGKLIVVLYNPVKLRCPIKRLRQANLKSSRSNQDRSRSLSQTRFKTSSHSTDIYNPALHPEKKTAIKHLPPVMRHHLHPDTFEIPQTEEPRH